MAVIAQDHLELVLASPAVRALVEAEDARVVDRRRQLVAELEALHVSHAAAIAPLEDAVATADLRVKAGQRALDEAKAVLAAARRARALEPGPIEAAIGSAERELRATDPVAIDAFLEDMASRAMAARSAFRSRDYFGPPNMFTGKRSQEVETNAASIEAIVAACQAARQAAEALRGTPIAAAELDVRLAELRATIPAVDRSLSPVSA